MVGITPQSKILGSSERNNPFLKAKEMVSQERAAPFIMRNKLFFGKK